MNKVVGSSVVALMLAVAPVTFAQSTAEPAARPNIGERAVQKVDRGLTKVESKLGINKSDAQDIRETLAELTDNALSEDGFDNLRMRLVDADRNRIAKFDLTDAQEKALEAKIESFRKAWQARYSEKFEAEDHDDEYLATALVEEGEFGRDAQLASEVKKNSEHATQSGNSDKNVDGNRKSDENLNDGRNIAVVTLAGMGGKDALRVPMIHEAPDSWKVNVPDRVTGETLYTNLDNTLTKITENQAEWPSDKNQAYQLVTYKIAKAVLDCANDPLKSDRAQPASDLQKPDFPLPDDRKHDAP